MPSAARCASSSSRSSRRWELERRHPCRGHHWSGQGLLHRWRPPRVREWDGPGSLEANDQQAPAHVRGRPGNPRNGEARHRIGERRGGGRRLQPRPRLRHPHCQRDRPL